jgi:tetratricopeptide (TPR) repeat protein
LLFGKAVASAGRLGPELTRRERDVLAALCAPIAAADVFAEPASVRDIADALVVTEAAVKQHLLHLYDKFGIAEAGGRRRVRLAREAVRSGAVELGELSPPARSGAGPDDLVEAGREAAARRDWDAAFRLLSDAHGLRPLEADDLKQLGEAGYWTDRHEESFGFQRSAYHAYAQAGDNAQTAYMALMLTIHHANRLDLAVAGGWFAKAERLLADAPECFAHGHHAVVSALFDEAAGDWPAMLEHARRALEIGARCGDADLQALGLAFQGLALTHLGEVAEGTRLLDEAMASAVAGELATMPTGIIYCRLLCACLDLQDFGRAHEWTKVIDRCAARPGLGGLPGDCRTHRAQVLHRYGAFAEGAREALRAVEETATLDLAHAGIAWRELGDIRLRQGDIEGADEAFVRAHEYGVSPEPGLALLRLARGELHAAGAGLESALEPLGAGQLARARLLPAKVEVALTAGDREAARGAVGELEETADTYRTPALAAVAEHARGAYELSAGDTAEAQRRLASALQLWQRVHAPYDAARARLLLAEAHVVRGDRDSGLLELRAAHAAFERLGARPDAERTHARLIELRG